ncbi:MAG TPA: hypothetical protein VGR95_17780 [Thermoanaerobaculia bacterium]|jgi:hypothetical protein|nr:hypothetical protein [Thermoanaerobaculia bacterium]
MQWSDIPSVWFIAGLVVLIILVFILQSNRVKRLRERLELLARELGWSEVRSSAFFVLAVQGLWNGYNVRIRRVPRQKRVPERIVATIRVQTPARIIITRRQRGIYAGRPLTLFGPPLIELPLYSQFWIRADEITLADRLMHSSAAAMLDRFLMSRHDIFRIGGDNLSIQRLSSTEPDEVARLAREELELLRAVIDALALRP